MAEKKKPYISPDLESEQLNLPEAWACVIENANDSTGHFYGGDVQQAPQWNCW